MSLSSNSSDFMNKCADNMADLLYKNVICPYCFKQLNYKKIKKYCNICGNEVKTNFLQNLFRKIPQCGQNGCLGFATELLCPECKKKLPTDYLLYKKYLSFCLLGVTGSGKSNFLTVMLNELMENQDSLWIPSALEEETQVRFSSDRKKLYENKTTLEASPAGVPPFPLLWRIRDKKKMSGNKIPTYSLAIFDGAGEDCSKVDPKISNYIKDSRTLFILLDPTTLTCVKEQIGNSVSFKNSKIANIGIDASLEMINKLTDYIRSNCDFNPDQLIDKDVAVIFTKFDLIKNMFGESGAAIVTRESKHLKKGAFDKSDADAVDAEIRDWLIRNNENKFVNAIETNFKKEKVRFFGVSSFGTAPDENGKIDDINPDRILDPFIWMLWKEGLVEEIRCS